MFDLYKKDRENKVKEKKVKRKKKWVENKPNV